VTAKLTPEQQVIVAELYPMALRIAQLYSRDDQLESIAAEALCDAVLSYRPCHIPLPSWCKARVKAAIQRAARKEETHRAAELAAARPDGDRSTADPDPQALLDKLPEPYRTAAIERWLRKQRLALVAIRAGVPRRKLPRVLKRAAEMIRELAADEA
jgi:DNA-directed RNA polymerase specialized sigma24 family protein